MKRKFKMSMLIVMVFVSSTLFVGCGCTNHDNDVHAPYTSKDSYGKPYFQVKSDFEKAGFTNITYDYFKYLTPDKASEDGTVNSVEINDDHKYDTDDWYKKDAPVKIFIRVLQDGSTINKYSGNISSNASNPSTSNNEQDLGAYITVFQDGVNKYLNDVKYPSAFNYNEYKFVKVDDSGDKVIGTTKISVKNVPEKMDAIVIFTPGADVNKYITHSVVVNGKVYQDDGSYAEAANRLLNNQ